MQVNLVLDKANLTGNVIFKQYQHIEYSLLWFINQKLFKNFKSLPTKS